MDTILSLDTYLTLLVNGSDSVWLDNFAMYCTKPMTWVLFYVVIIAVFAKNVDRRTLLYILGGLLLCVLISDQVSSSLVKPLVCRLRPTHDPSIMHLVDTVNDYRGGQYGFFSAHAANTMSIALFLSLSIRRRVATLTLIMWSLLNCWTRLYLGVHFVGDILVGLIFGALVGCILFHVARKMPKFKKSTFGATGGYVILGAFMATIIILTIMSA